MSGAVAAVDAKPIMPSNTNKRKRQAADNGGGRQAPATDFSRADGDGSANLNGAEASFLGQDNPGAGDQVVEGSAGDIDFGQLAQHTTDPSLQAEGDDPANVAEAAAASAALSYHSMQVPQATEMTFQPQGSPGNGDSDRQLLADANMRRRGTNEYDFDQQLRQATMGNMGGSASSPTSANAKTKDDDKPRVGSDEWNKIRRDNHKEVERRRRETINEGINELQKIVPGCEKNKGSILQSAVRFITQLKENETANIEKWTLEKLLTEQAIAELSSKVDSDTAKAASEAARADKATAELEAMDKKLKLYQAACEEHGIVPDELKAESAGDKD